MYYYFFYSNANFLSKYATNMLYSFQSQTRENSLEEVQGAASSSLFPPPLFQDSRPCVQLLCVECNAPCQWYLAFDKAEPSTPTGGMTGQWLDRSAMSSHKTLLPLGHTSCVRSLALKTWTSFWRREDSRGMDTFNDRTVPSSQPTTYRLKERVGLGGPRWTRSSWQRGIAESGDSLLSTLMI